MGRGFHFASFLAFDGKQGRAKVGTLLEGRERMSYENYSGC